MSDKLQRTIWAWNDVEWVNVGDQLSESHCNFAIAGLRVYGVPFFVEYV